MCGEDWGSVCVFNLVFSIIPSSHCSFCSRPLLVPPIPTFLGYSSPPALRAFIRSLYLHAVGCPLSLFVSPTRPRVSLVDPVFFFFFNKPRDNLRPGFGYTTPTDSSHEFWRRTLPSMSLITHKRVKWVFLKTSVPQVFLFSFFFSFIRVLKFPPEVLDHMNGSSIKCTTITHTHKVCHCRRLITEEYL